MIQVRLSIALAGILIPLFRFEGSAAEVLVSHIGDTENGGIKRYDADTGAYIGEFLFDNNVKGMAWGPDGLLYAVDQRMNRVMALNTADESATVFIATGLDRPADLKFGPDGNLYVSDREALKKFDPASGSSLGSLPIADALGFAFGPDSYLYVAKLGGLNQHHAETGALVKQIRSGFFQNIELGGGGEIFASVLTDDQVWRFDPPGFSSLKIAAAGGGLDGPAGMAIGPDGLLYVVSNMTGSVKRFDPATGAYVDDFIAAGGERLFGPSDIIFTVSNGIELTVTYHPESATVTISWSKTGGTYILQKQTSVGGDWVPVETEAVEADGNYNVQAPVSGDQAFFRLAASTE